MTQKSEPQGKLLDALKWGSVAIVITVGMIGNYYYTDINLLARVVLLLAFAIGAGAIALWTVRGNALWALALEARTEMRKVVWPTRQETIKVTALVMLMVVVMSLILWGVDALVFKIVAWLTGLGAV